MSKADLKMIFILFLFFICFVFMHGRSDNGSNALVYYNGNLVMTIDLSVDGKYEVSGENGLVFMEVLDGKIRVNEENSPNHICSLQGFISKSYESIVCLPNKIVINISDNLYDAVVK